MDKLIYLLLIIACDIFKGGGGGGGGGVHHWNFGKHDFEIMVDQKVYPVSQLFGWVCSPKTIWRRRGGRAHFPPKMGAFF